jgi:uncharacterized protein (TIGR03643 family)
LHGIVASAYNEVMSNQELIFGDGDASRIIEMAWEDRTPFEAIERTFGLNESAVISFMRTNLKASSFRMWRKRVTGRSTKHAALRPAGVKRAYCPTQYKRM